jgi:hypothetical protein
MRDNPANVASPGAFDKKTPTLEARNDGGQTLPLFFK